MSMARFSRTTYFSCWKLRTVQAFKSVVVLRLCGVAVVQVCKGYIWFSVTGSSIFAFDAHTMTCTSPVSLRCRNLGATLSYVL